MLEHPQISERLKRYRAFECEGVGGGVGGGDPGMVGRGLGNGVRSG